MKIQLTRNQIIEVLVALSYSYNNDYPKSDSKNASILRIENKLKKLIN